MIFLSSLQEVPITTPPVEDIKSVFAWIIGVLVIFVGVILKIILSQNKDRIDDLKNQITALETTNIALDLKLSDEIKYAKEQGLSTMKVLMDNTNVLRTTVKTMENLGADVSDIKPVVKSNNDIVKEIKYHQQNN